MLIFILLIALSLINVTLLTDFSTKGSNACKIECSCFVVYLAKPVSNQNLFLNHRISYPIVWFNRRCRRNNVCVFHIVDNWNLMVNQMRNIKSIVMTSWHWNHDQLYFFLKRSFSHMCMYSAEAIEHITGATALHVVCL